MHLMANGPTYNPTSSQLPFGQRAEEALALLAAVVESSDDAIITKTLEGFITSWNGAAARLLGYTATEAIGQPITMLIPPERLAEEHHIIENLRAGNRIEQYETVRIAKGGRQIEVALTISPIRDRNGRIVGASKIMRDVTERMRIERSLQELLAERNRLLESERAARSQAERVSATKDDFLALLSHELRTPLHAILGWTQILRRGTSKPADLANGLEVIERNVRAQNQLVDDLLDINRITAGQMRLDVQPVMPYGFVQAAVDSVRPAADARGVRVEAILDPAAGPVSGDAYRLQQVVWNLVSNAIKFTPKGGRAQVILQRTDSQVEIKVADSGIGIHADFLPHVFERFRQADASSTRTHRGLGLGLAIVKHIVELHGGTATVSSAGEGQGATFTVRLPISVIRRNPLRHETHPRSSQAASVSLVSADLSNLVVLVVDDDLDSLKFIRRILGDEGAMVITAGSAAEGLAAIDKQWPDVLISDIGMPETDGYELMRKVRSLQPKLGVRFPGVALTAFARTEDRTRALLAGFVAHVAKPVEAAELIATIAAVTGRTGSTE
jgi:PAS domain S-box-containing protein